MGISPKCTTIAIAFHKSINLSVCSAPSLQECPLLCTSAKPHPPQPLEPSLPHLGQTELPLPEGKVKEWFIPGFFALLALPYKLQIQGMAKVCTNRRGPCLVSWTHSLALLHLFTQIQLDSHIVILAHSHPMFFSQATRFDVVIPSKMFHFWAESSHRFWRAWSFQLHLLHPSLERVGSPLTILLHLIYCVLIPGFAIGSPVTLATSFPLLALQFLIL